MLVAKKACNGTSKNDEVLTSLSRLTNLRHFSLDPVVAKYGEVIDLVYDVLFYLDARHRLFYIKRPVIDSSLVDDNSERWVWGRINEMLGNR